VVIRVGLLNVLSKLRDVVIPLALVADPVLLIGCHIAFLQQREQQIYLSKLGCRCTFLLHLLHMQAVRQHSSYKSFQALQVAVQTCKVCHSMPMTPQSICH
jgi:hypothetical protein